MDSNSRHHRSADPLAYIVKEVPKGFRIKIWRKAIRDAHTCSLCLGQPHCQPFAANSKVSNTIVENFSHNLRL